MRFLIQITCFLFLSSCSSKITKDKAGRVAVINEAIRELLHSDIYLNFNGSILVAKNGKIIAEQSYGFVDINKTALITSESRFNVGSAAKEIPGIAILDLIAEGKLSYQDNLSNYLDYLPSWSRKITIRDLLFYESGLPHMNLLTSNSDKNAINDIKKIDSLLFEPRSSYLYSNWNNFLQAQLVETVVGIDFQSYIKRRYFDPLKMYGAIYTSNPPKITKNITKSYHRLIGDDALNNSNFKHFELCFGPLYMTPQDLLKWVEYVRIKYQKDGVGSKEFFTETTVEKQGPLGVIEKALNKVSIHRHGGAAYSFETLIYRNYRDGIAIILMTNSSRPHELDRLSDSILEILNKNHRPD